MNIGDRVHIAPGASSVVIIRELHNDDGLVMVEHETPGTGVYPYLTKPDHFIPATSTDRRRRTRPGPTTTSRRRRRQLPRRTQQHLTRHTGAGAGTFHGPAPGLHESGDD